MTEKRGQEQAPVVQRPPRTEQRITGVHIEPMVISTRPRDWADAARRIIFGERS